MSKRAAIYARVSSDEQSQNGSSLITQLKACEAYAARNGMRVIARFEDDYSGRFLDRPEFNRLRDLVRSGELDAVITHAMDRYTREPAHIDILLDELVDHDVELHTSSGLQDISTSEGRMFLGIQAQFGRFWWQKIREASMRARNHIKENGKLYGNAAPYGYRVAGEKLNYRLEMYEPEAEVIRLIYRLADEGAGSMIIANTLTSYGYQPPRRERWHPPAIIHMLHNTTYKGQYAYRFRVVKGKRITLPPEEWTFIPCPAIVDPEVWERVNQRLSLTGRRFVRKHFFLLAGRLTCACGYAMTAFPNEQRSGKGHYGCNGRKVVKNGCQMPYLKITGVDNAFWQWVRELLLDPAAKLAALDVAEAERQATAVPLEKEYARLEQEAQKLQKRLTGYENMRADGEISRTVFKAHKEEIESRLSVLERDMQAIETKLSMVRVPDSTRHALETLFERLDTTPELLDKLTTEQRRELLVALDLYGSVALENGVPVLYVHWYGYEERCIELVRRTV